MQLFTPALVLLLPVALACDAGVFCAAVAPRHRPAAATTAARPAAAERNTPCS
jgi:hypothetical protein